MKEVILYTDGACSGNPGPGGWAAILRYGQSEKVLSGGEAETTNNRMELLGVIHGLAARKEGCAVTLFTDSLYVANALNNGWLRDWKKRGWWKVLTLRSITRMQALMIISQHRSPRTSLQMMWR